MTDFVPYTHPAVTRVYTTAQLVEQLYANLRFLAPDGQEHAYISGYLFNVLKDVAERGVDELTANVDWTNQQAALQGGPLRNIAK